jgi:hypothetical protein
MQIVEGDAGLGLQAVYATNSVDTPAEEWFAVIVWGVSTKSYGTTGSDRVAVWFHDKQKDYGRINRALERLKQLLGATVGFAGADGIVLSAAEWNGEGPDLRDDGYGTLTRYAEFTTISRYASV